MSILSPCVDVCRLHAATGWCEGCGRSIDEIAAWGRLDDESRRQVWAQLPMRLERLQQLGVPTGPRPR